MFSCTAKGSLFWRKDFSPLKADMSMYFHAFPFPFSSHVDSDNTQLFPGKQPPPWVPFAVVRAMLTEETHLPFIVKKNINSPLCHSDKSLFADRKTHTCRVQIYHSSCQRNLFSCNMNRRWVGGLLQWDPFLPRRPAGCAETPSKTGHAVHIMEPQSHNKCFI